MLFNLCKFNGQFVPTSPLANCGFDYFTQYLKNKKRNTIHFGSIAIIFDCQIKVIHQKA